MSPPARAILAAVLLTLSRGWIGTSRAETATAPTDAGITVRELDTAIDATLVKPEYAWRAPREKVIAEPGFLASFLARIAEKLRKFGNWLLKKLKWLEEWWRDHFSWRRHDADRSPGIIPVKALWVLAAVLVVVLLGLVLYRTWKRRRHGGAVTAMPVATLPDIMDEDVVADQLPAERWMEMAVGFADRGEWRLALRAMFLAGLAHLGHCRLIQIAKHKSNRDYRRELDRRAHDRPPLLAAFQANVGILESVWYGAHAADRYTVDGFRANQDVILQTGNAPSPGIGAAPSLLSETREEG